MPARPRLSSVILFGLLLVAATLAGGGTAVAEIDGQALARSNACLACHQVDARRVGPPFREIGKRYATGSADREATLDYLQNVIRQGGRGRWGAIPMPAQPRVSEKDARALGDWILKMGE